MVSAGGVHLHARGHGQGGQRRLTLLRKGMGLRSSAPCLRPMPQTKGFAHLLQQDVADCPYFHQEWKCIPETTPIISGGRWS
jgi:hypothetical protein